MKENIRARYENDIIMTSGEIQVMHQDILFYESLSFPHSQEKITHIKSMISKREKHLAELKEKMK